MHSLELYIESTQKVADHLCAMLGYEQEKRRALLRDEQDRLESMLQTQQAAIMKLESLEKKRAECQVAAGFSNMTSSEVLASMNDGPDKDILTDLFSKLQETAKVLQEQNKMELDIAKMYLQLSGSFKPASKAEFQGVYKPHPTPNDHWVSGSAFEEKI